MADVRWLGAMAIAAMFIKAVKVPLIFWNNIYM